MKQALRIEGNAEGAASLFLHLAVLLAQYKLQPAALAWRRTEEREIRLWLSLEGEAAVLHAFVESCRNVYGVQYLALESAEACEVVAERIGALATRWPCAPAGADGAARPGPGDFMD